MDWRGFEPLTPRVQGEYSTSLNYQPMAWFIDVWILIVVFTVLAKILFPKNEPRVMVLLESQIKLNTGDQAPNFELLGIDDKKQFVTTRHKLKEFFSHE